MRRDGLDDDSNFAVESIKLMLKVFTIEIKKFEEGPPFVHYYIPNHTPDQCLCRSSPPIQRLKVGDVLEMDRWHISRSVDGLFRI